MFRTKRTTTLRTIVFLCIVSLTAVFIAAGNVHSVDQNGPAGSRMIENGKEAPAFEGEKLGGGNFDLAQHVGKTPVLLFFWSFFCQPCREEMPILQKVHEEPGMGEILFVGINLDGPKLGKAIEKFMTDSNLAFTTVFDELNGMDYKIAGLYGVMGTPTIYIINQEGKVTFSGIGKVDPEDLKKALKNSLG